MQNYDELYGDRINLYERNNTTTVQNLTIYEIQNDRNLVSVKVKIHF